MKKGTVEIIEAKFKKDIDAIYWELRKNKLEIKRLAEKQKQLKDARKGLYEILRLIK
jgi:hypothetical protein